MACEFGFIQRCRLPSCKFEVNKVFGGYYHCIKQHGYKLEFANTQDARCCLLRFVLLLFSHFVYREFFFDAGRCLLTGVFGVLCSCYFALPG